MQVRKAYIAATTLAVLALILLWRSPWVRRRQPAEWRALEAASALAHAVQMGTGTDVLSLVAVPESVANCSHQEQSDFILRALRDEVTEDGIRILRRDGRFGPLADIFPEEAAKWAAAAGVRIEDCAAFRLDRPTHRIEVAFTTNQPDLKLIRVNDVRP